MTRDVVRWYFERYFGSSDDAGVPASFADPERVGFFAVEPEQLRRGDPRALFRLLVATTMFQRRQDVQIMRILRGISREDAAELTSAPRLLRLVDESECEHLRSNRAMIDVCNLTKDPATRRGTCAHRPELSCHLKRHTVLLKRYGHFGKVPSSAAMALRDGGVRDLRALYKRVFAEEATPRARAEALEAALSRAWRVSEKIACMFLSAVTNPDLSRFAPWSDGLEWEHFVVVDSNVDLFLKSIAYRGTWTYAARREFVKSLAAQIDLSEFDRKVRPYNPRLVQQAIYLFMSAANRRAIPRDCSFDSDACARCPRSLASRCLARPGARQSSTAKES